MKIIRDYTTLVCGDHIKIVMLEFTPFSGIVVKDTKFVTVDYYDRSQGTLYFTNYDDFKGLITDFDIDQKNIVIVEG